ncbi:MAG TPA: ROK family transcriptional regulator [Roseiarcus sp.]|nr:ROK family transcriptional regulator [Roseiarcus sp.]
MKTADPELMRAINRFHVMDSIRRHGPISRVEICGRTDLSPTTVSAITAALIEDGLIVARPIGDVRDATRGRPRVMLELNPEAAYVVGVKLAPDQITIAATNFRADVLASLALPIRISRQPASVVADLVEDGVRRCLADADLTVARIAGLCVGLPGVVERASGVCRQSTVFGERDLPFAKELSGRLGLPVSIDTDVNLVTLAEHWFGEVKGLSDFLVVSIEDNLGLGIMHNGELFRGAGGLSPDLGDLLVRPNAGDGRNRLASIASETAIVGEALDAVDGKRDRFAKIGKELDKVIELAQEGDQRFIGILAAAGDALGFAIANLITLFAPPKVILGGAAVKAGPLLLEPLRETASTLVPASLAHVAEIVVHQWSDEMWARGAAAMTLRDLYGAPWNTTGPALLR